MVILPTIFGCLLMRPSNLETVCAGGQKGETETEGSNEDSTTAYACYEEGEMGVGFIGPFAFTLIFEGLVMLCGLHWFRTLYTFLETLYVVGFVLFFTAEYYLRAGWFWFNNTYGPYYEWVMFLGMYIIPHCFA